MRSLNHVDASEDEEQCDDVVLMVYENKEKQEIKIKIVKPKVKKNKKEE